MKSFKFDNFTHMHNALGQFKEGLPAGLIATETHNGEKLQWDIVVRDASNKEVAILTAKNETGILTIDAGTSSMKLMLEKQCELACGSWGGRQDRAYD